MEARTLVNLQARVADVKGVNDDPLLMRIKKADRIGVMLRGWAMLSDDDRARAKLPAAGDGGRGPLTNLHIVDTDKVALTEAFAGQTLILADRVGILLRGWRRLSRMRQAEALMKPEPAAA